VDARNSPDVHASPKQTHGAQAIRTAGLQAARGYPPPASACLQARELLLARRELLALEQPRNQRSKLLVRQRRKLQRPACSRSSSRSDIKSRSTPQRAPLHEGAAANEEREEDREAERRGMVTAFGQSAAHDHCRLIVPGAALKTIDHV
jgi:hypothetical protein